jgi:hypothetical protein
MGVGCSLDGGGQVVLFEERVNPNVQVITDKIDLIGHTSVMRWRYARKYRKPSSDRR